jgi:NAD(P)H-quinone oxidoreductase subunit 4L
MFEIGLYHYIGLATILFCIGLYGVLTSRNAIRLLMCIELMLNAVNINLVAFNNFVNMADLSGQVFSIFILTVSAAEAAVGLAILIALYRRRSTVDVERFSALKW